MYEFKYPEVANVSVADIETSVYFLIQTIKNKLNNKNEVLSEIEREIFKNTINHLKSGFNVSLNMSNQNDIPIDYRIIDDLIEKSHSLKMPLQFYVSGNSLNPETKDPIPMLFSQTSLDNLIELHNYLVDKGENGLLFMENSSKPELSWTFDDVLDASDQIDSIVEFIKEQNFTQFETIAFIHQYISTQYEYRENLSNPISSRSIVGSLNYEDIVCVGYSYLTKAIIDKLNMPGLECSTFISKITPKQNTSMAKTDSSFTGVELIEDGSYHMQNLIKINDSTYNISGSYINDVCSDSKSPNTPNGKGISNLMFPVEDLIHYKYFDFDQTSPQIEDMLKLIGKSVTKNSLDCPIIAENINNSKPIPLENYKKCLINIFKKLNPEKPEKQVKENVSSILTLSKLCSFELFDKNAIGSISKDVYKNIEMTSKENGIEME